MKKNNTRKPKNLNTFARVTVRRKKSRKIVIFQINNFDKENNVDEKIKCIDGGKCR